MPIPRCRAPRKSNSGVPCWNRVENEGDRCGKHYGSPAVTLAEMAKRRKTNRERKPK